MHTDVIRLRSIFKLIAINMNPRDAKPLTQLKSNIMRHETGKVDVLHDERYPLIEGIYGVNGFYFQVTLHSFRMQRISLKICYFKATSRATRSACYIQFGFGPRGQRC